MDQQLEQAVAPLVAGELEWLARWFAGVAQAGETITIEPRGALAWAHAFQQAGAVLRGQLAPDQAAAPVVDAGQVVRVDFVALGERA